MINTSNEYKKYIADSINSTLSRDFTAMADIELADNTVLNVTEKDIVLGGLKIDDSTSPSNSFQIGTAIINQCTLMLNNIGGKFNQYDFTDAIIRPYIGLKLSETTEILQKGVFTVDEPTLASSIISLVALDNMEKFDTPFSEVTISFPCTQLQLLQAVCLHCGVSLATVTFTNSDFIVTRRPSDEATTCREIVSWIAQNGGNFAKCNTQGALELKWYDFGAFETGDSVDGGRFDEDTPYSTGDSADGGNFTDYNSGNSIDGGTFLDMDRYHHIYALSQTKIGTDDVIITGIQVKAQGTESDYGETVLFGTSGYVIEITNPLIQENTAGTIANSVGAKIVGMRFRPCSISTISDPSREAGDVGKLSHKGNTYQILLTSVSSQIGGSDNLSCDAETPSRKQSVRFDAQTKAIIEARKNAKEQLTAYDQAVQQLTNLMTNSFGVHKSEEELEDGSIIYYMHNKPTLAASSTIWKMTADAFAVSTDGGKTWGAGFDSNGNAVLNVLNAIGINADWINVGTIKGIRVEMADGKIGKFNITKGGLENDTFKLYDADGSPWMWMHDLDTKESTTMQTIGFAKRHEKETYQEWTDLQDELKLSKIALDGLEDLHVTTFGKNGIYSYTENMEEDGSFSIISDYGTVSFYDSYAVFQSYSGGSISFDNGNATLDANNCSILLNGDDIYLNANRGRVYVNGYDILDNLQSIESDIRAIKARIGLT